MLQVEQGRPGANPDHYMTAARRTRAVPMNIPTPTRRSAPTPSGYERPKTMRSSRSSLEMPARQASATANAIAEGRK